ncbi:DNA-3-methyladenine glycosylase 2 family protein [Flavobacterium sp. DG1-102-2]|uniref:DNA-3-methyladenine glycosylase family protein n=1 Tax=Flavobacterium sp. DG1-102-2 TaxID=3081663 RepID=UPI002949A130|nr:DNA-3-methyladenine glycosylase 2 family protein [Flavobacterium sp. DG1-102-2]MDV6168913.1 DNA-3-methyladenine glycosylase 2 family protein [Flavobacterium sp. DG1-102-2]
MEHTIPLLVQLDTKFAAIADLYGMPGFVGRKPGFESLCLMILEQQVSLNSAKASFDKLKNLIEEFTPQNSIEITDQEFRQCGVSRQKTAYIRNLAEAILNGNIFLESFIEKDHDTVRKELVALKGIGNWTADIYLMFCLQAPDILPLGDIGIISAIKDVWGFTTLEEIKGHSEKWKPYRTTAAFFLWHYYLKKRNRIFPH